MDSRLPRVAFDFIVKSDIKIFVWFVDKSKGFYFVCRGRRPRRPESIRITAVHPSVIFFDCRGDHRSSEVVSVTNCTFVHRRNNDLYLIVGVDVPTTRGRIGYKLHLRLLPKSTIYVSLLQREKVDRPSLYAKVETDEVFVK